MYYFFSSTNFIAKEIALKPNARLSKANSLRKYSILVFRNILNLDDTDLNLGITSFSER